MDTSSSNILLTNLIKIRWVAILGQLTAILTVFFYFNIQIPIVACLCIIFISSLINTYSFLTNSNNSYLSEKDAFYFLLFDTIQLGVLLYFTGGIYNPFSLLLIAPLIISASYLPIVFSLCLLFLSICIIILISNFYFFIDWNENFEVPFLYKFAIILSLIISLIFIFTYVYLFANSSRKISKALFDTKSALDNQKKITEIGSLSAAAVHELSTPLNTIFLILNDLQEDSDLNSNKNLKKEINLLKSQAERCKAILLKLSKNPENLKDNFLNRTTISNLIKLTFDKFNNKKIKMEMKLKPQIKEPEIISKDELIYGIGNIIQNSIQHAKSKVMISINWNNTYFFITIIDDGLGFKNETLDNLGKPYISKKGDGMGLGIFITKNLIENMGGLIFFQNDIKFGARVEIKMIRDS
jgi:two-component system, sensor histidine kinase RegB